MGSFSFSALPKVGLQHDLPKHIAKRITPTNIIALVMMLGIGVPFTILSFIYFPKLAIYPALGSVFCVIAILLNHFGSTTYSRVIISLVPISLGAIYNAFLSGVNDDPLPSLYLIELSFALVPFVVFDLKEKVYIVILTVICTILILSFPYTKLWFTSHYDTTILRTGWLSTLTIVLAIISEFSCILGLAFINKGSEDESNQLIESMNSRNQLLEEAQAASEENLKKVKLSQEEEKKRNWAAEGITEVSEILRSNKDSKEIFDIVTSNIIKYINANQGGLYIVEKGEEENTIIKLASCYAFSRKKYLEQEYTPGQGLLGQVYLEEEYLLMTDIPQEYVTITSGLGDANPKALIIIPLIINDEVEGLLEIASFKGFEEHHISFLHKVGENIASYIQTNRINQRTVKLLQSAQVQAEELRAQEEEMKQNMEELSATQEEMHRKEKEYHKVIEDLKSEVIDLKELV